MREFFLLTAGIQVSTGVILSLSGIFNLTIHGERYCVLGEFWKEADGDQLLLRPGEESVWYYAHEKCYRDWRAQYDAMFAPENRSPQQDERFPLTDGYSIRSKAYISAAARANFR